MVEIRQPCGKMWDLEEIQVGEWEKYGSHVVKCETWVNSGRRPLLRKFLKLLHLPGPTSPHLLSANTRIGWSPIQIQISTLYANKNVLPVGPDWNWRWLRALSSVWPDGRPAAGDTKSHWCEISASPPHPFLQFFWYWGNNTKVRNGFSCCQNRSFSGSSFYFRFNLHSRIIPLFRSERWREKR